MPSTSYRAHPDLLVYYGSGALDTLARYRRVALQANHYSPADVARLKAAGTSPIAYISLGEDTGPAAPWQLAERNPVWGGYYVAPGHPGWLEHVRNGVERVVAAGYDGLLLDTLETPPILAGHGDELLRLVTTVREVVGNGYLLANRGYALHRQLAPLVDGFLFEAFSTTWEGGYRALRGTELQDNSSRLRAIQATGKELYALDYANRPGLADFAVQRGANLGLRVQVTDREVTGLPLQQPVPARG